MPKSVMICPQDVRASGQLEFQPIPINQYHRTLEEERSRFSDADLTRIYRDMATIRAFETMLNDVKIKGSYGGIEYNHRGPAHLSIGQEASAVGQAYLLDRDDHIFGSHRSHGEILAKSLSAIHKLDDATLTQIMTGYMDGAILKALEKPIPGGETVPKPTSVKEQAMEFLLYGALAEIFGREAGFNKGMGGSMHAFFIPFGSLPEQCAGRRLRRYFASGAALYKKVNRKSGLVICNIGDAAANCGPTWEALCFATMDQFKTLWDEAHRGGLPLIMNFVNNFYGMGGQPVGETGGFGTLARMGAGLNPEQMHAERVDGYNPLAVIDAIARKKELLARGDGPVLLDTVTYRFSGHSPSDASSYREKAEIEEWQKVDCLLTYAQDLIAAELCYAPTIWTRRRASLDAAIMRAYRRAIDLDLSPRADLYAVGNLLEKTMYSNGKVESFDPDARAGTADACRRRIRASSSLAGRSPLGPRRRTASCCRKARCIGDARRAVRGDPAPLRSRSDAGRLWRGEPRLGRGVRGLSRPDGGAALPSPVQQPHLRGGHRRNGGRLRAGRRAGADRTDVLRLPGPRGRRGVQPALEVAEHERRRPEDAGRHARLGGQQVRRAALARTGPRSARIFPA